MQAPVRAAQKPTASASSSASAAAVATVPPAAAAAADAATADALTVEVEVLPLLAMVCCAAFIYHCLDVQLWWSLVSPT